MPLAPQRGLELKTQEQENQTRTWLQQEGYDDLLGLVDAGQANLAFNEALKRQQPGYGQPEKTATQRDFEAAQSNPEYMDFLNRGRSGGALGTTIYTGRDANGNIVPMQVGQGGFVPSTLPEGVSFDPGAMNAERAYGTQIGKGQGDAVVAAPEAIATAQRTLSQIQNLKGDPGLWWSTGNMGWTPNLPGNPQAGTISRIEQLQGAAFLEAFESLKGGGQITEVEGTKATNAIARLQRSQSYQDFTQALTELEEVVQIGLERAKRQGQGGAPMPSFGGAGRGGSGDPLGLF